MVLIKAIKKKSTKHWNLDNILQEASSFLDIFLVFECKQRYRESNLATNKLAIDNEEIIVSNNPLAWHIMEDFWSM